MTRYQRMHDCLTQHFAPLTLLIENESNQHRGHRDGPTTDNAETHYAITLKSPILKGLSRVQQHQKIYNALDNEFKTGLHALRITVHQP